MKRRKLLAALAAGAGVILGGGLVRSASVRLDATEDATEAPRWVQVAAAGDFKGHPSGGFKLDRDSFETMVANLHRHPSFKAGPDGVGTADVIPFDFHHANEQPASLISDRGAPAQGWVLDMQVRDAPTGPQLWALARWLEPARSYIREGRYKWCSIAAWPKARDQKSGADIGWYISSVALTNDPFIQGMAPVTAGYMHDPYNRPGSAEDVLECIVEILELPWSATNADVSEQLSMLEDAVRGRGGDIPQERVEDVVQAIAQCLNLPVLTDPEDVVRTAQKLIGQATAPMTAARAAESESDMDLLIKLAERLGVSTGVILAARKDDPKALAALEAETMRAFELALLERDGTKKGLSVLLESLGIADESKAAQRVVELLKSEEELKKLEPEIAAMKKDKADSEAKAVEADVEAAIEAHRLPKTSRPALLHFRRSDPAQFSASYPTPPKGMTHITADLTRGGEHRQAPQGAPVAGAPVTLSTPAQLLGYSGRNDLERAISFVRAQPGGDRLSWEDSHARGTEVLRQLRMS